MDMKTTVVALYDRISIANYAVQELIDSGFSPENISLIAADATGAYANYFDYDIMGGYGTDTMDEEIRAERAAEGASTGAGIGAILGGLGGVLVGFGLIAIPGIGPLLAAGPLAAALTGLAGAGVGAVAGGLVGALADLGLPEETAELYAEAVRRGGVLVVAHVSEHMSDKARRIMDEFGAVDIRERMREWEDDEWDEDEYIPEATETLNYYGAEYPDDFYRHSHRFREHYRQNLSAGGYTFDEFQPAYYFGYTMANEPEYSRDNWDMLEPEIRERWEQERPGTWESFKTSIRYAWEELKDGPG